MRDLIRPTLATVLLTVVLLTLTTILGCSKVQEAPRYTGYVEAELVYVAAPTAGWLVASPLREGDLVSPQDLLFELDHDLEQAQLEEAAQRLRQTDAQFNDISLGARREEISVLESQLQEAKAIALLAESERRRWTELVDSGVAAQERSDQVIADQEAADARVQTLQANIEVARLGGRSAALSAASASKDATQAVLAQAQWRLDQRRVLARVGGRVEDVFHRLGDYVPAGSPVLALLPEAALKVRFFISQADLAHVAPGTKVSVLVDGQLAPIEASVSYIAQDAEFTPPVIYSARSREKLVFLVEARLAKESSLRPGQPVDVLLQ